MEKRGDALVSRELIIMIFAIAGFIIVLFFIIGFTDILNTQEEICKTSVIYRATAPEAASLYIPLKCTTRKVCLTGDKDCTQFTGEKRNVQKPVNLPADDQRAADIIEETLANEMYDCWNMMGEGKVSLFNGGVKKHYGFDSDKVACMICSRIAVNLPEDELNDTMNLVDVNEYMRTTQVPGSDVTYLNAFTDRSTNTYARTPENFDQEIEGDQTIRINSDSRNQYAVVFSQIKPKQITEVVSNLLNLGATGAGTTVLTTGISSLKFASSGPALVLTAVGGGGVILYAMHNAHQGKVAAGNYCGSFTSADEAYNLGCSTVQILPYDVNAINSICGYIEGSG